MRILTHMVRLRVIAMRISISMLMSIATAKRASTITTTRAITAPTIIDMPECA